MASSRRVAALLAVAGGALFVAAPAAPAGAAVAGVVRLDQVGYVTGEAKQAYLMTPAPAPGARYSVVNAQGHTVLSGRVGASNGAWNDRYGAVHPIDFSGLRAPGRYHITVGNGVTATSPAFTVAGGESLFGPLVGNAVRFFQVQRDGARIVPGTLDRRKSHLADRKATVYEAPVFTGDGGDVPAEPLRPVAGAAPVDVEGGWFDAGDFVKFTHASAYATAEMLYAQRALDSGSGSLADESAHGLAWLDKMWDAGHKVLYVQVGIGTGSEEFNFLGDHDVWRLPEADDALDTRPGDLSYFLKYRPVFRAAAPGGKVSPNLAGRMAASFALGAQLAADRGDRAAAARWLGQAATVYAQAKTTDVGELVTAFPHAYYPEDSWEDDMEFGAVELALAACKLGDRRGAGWLADARRWAAAYIASDHKDTLNLYDTSALAHADLIRAGGRDATIVADLKRQLDSGVAAAAGNPLRHAVDVTEFDAASRSLGYAATAKLYQSVTGDGSYAAFGTRQRAFSLGNNAWGVSLVVGAGSTFPHCPHHQVANLAGSHTGDPRKVITGAVVNGPNAADNFTDLSMPDGFQPCAVDFAAFDTATARYLDDTRAWASNEPAIDFTGTSTLAFALAAA